MSAADSEADELSARLRQEAEECEACRRRAGTASLITGLALGAAATVYGFIAMGTPNSQAHNAPLWIGILTALGVSMSCVVFGLTEWSQRPARRKIIEMDQRGRRIERALVEHRAEIRADVRELAQVVHDLKPQIEREYGRREWTGMRQAFAEDLDLTGTDGQVLHLPSSRTPN